MKSTILLIVCVFVVVLGVTAYSLRGWTGQFKSDNPWDAVPKEPSPTDHSGLFEGKQFDDGPAVTRACLTCHEHAARDFMASSHWTWLGDEVRVPGRDEPIRIGKYNLINNFCISIESNWPKCTKCHAGYGWRDADFDFSNEEAVDCLVCHDQSGQYDKADAGVVAPGVDLLAAAKSVGRPTRDNCGYCHFNGGGGDAVKHGDLDGSLARPVERVDVHMGRHDFPCIDCHQTEQHQISGRAMSVRVSGMNAVKCTECHQKAPHRNDRLNAHGTALACQTCHLPQMAVKHPTKMAWDWSTAGRDFDVEDAHVYLKKKGSFLYAKGVVPEYFWFNGTAQRYLKGDPIDPETVTHINRPNGDIADPTARIWPFKIHMAKQPYDEVHRYLLIPKTVGPGGYWTDFDWEQAVRLATDATGLAFSGELGFAETDMYWPLTHMIAPKERALQCTDCHGSATRMNWRALGYPEDPAFVGGRDHLGLVPSGKEPGS